MNCEVQGVYKNLRYRILVIDEEAYILDMGRSFGKIIFPFFFWLFPNSIFKINDQKIIEKLKTPKVNQANTGGLGLIGGGVGVLLANLLRPLMDYFNIQGSPIINSLIVVMIVILLFLLRFFINNMDKKKLYQIVKLEQLPKDRLWIRPKTTKHFFSILFYYLFCLGFVIAGFVAFIELGNVIMLFFTTLFLFILLVMSAMTVILGNTTVKFKGKKETVV